MIAGERTMADHDCTEGTGGEPPMSEQLERIEAALLTLPRFTREVFLACRLDELSYAEIADITGTSVQRIEREIARAMAEIDRAMRRDPPRGWWSRLSRW